MTPLPAAEAPAATAAPAGDELLELLWPGRGLPIRGRALRLELGVSATFLLAAGALALSADPARGIHPVAAVLVVAYALAARVEFPIGNGCFVPTQLFLVPLFVVAPPQYVPLLVFAAFLLAAVGAAIAGSARLDRVIFSAGDAMHTLGPALVITLLAHGEAAHAGVFVLAGAFAAQLIADLASSSCHGLLSMGARPKVHLWVMLQIWGTDIALGTVGVLAARMALDNMWAALTPLPVLLLLRRLAIDRVRKLSATHERMGAFELERERRRAAVELLQRQIEFLQDVSHELRTPVTIARGHLENLQRSSGRSPDSDVALDELGRIGRIIERLLVLARADQPDTLHPQRLDAESFLEDCFVRWSDTVARPWQLGELATGTLTADGDALRAALDALLENAVKHTTASERILIRSRVERDGLVIEVADAGGGIPAEALHRIFERFARAETAHNLLTGGVGLGLSMVDGVAKAHGGRCSVASSPAGSVFSLRLPRFEGHEQHAGVSIDSATVESRLGAGPGGGTEPVGLPK